MYKRAKVFGPTKQRLLKKRKFSFDIQTHNNNTNFTCCTITGLDIPSNNNKEKPYLKTFYTKEEVVNELKTNYCFRNSIIFATDLSYSFMGTFFNTEDEQCFHIIPRGASFLYTKTYFEENNFTYQRKRKSSRKSRKTLEFYDTLNFAKLTVSEMGEHLGIKRLEIPIEVQWETNFELLDTYPRTQEEMDYLVSFNTKDAKITLQYMNFFIDVFERAGGTFKITIGSCSMSLFKNKYLKDKYYQKDKEILREELKSYYGGRVEAFARGRFKNAFLNDFNSLYPSAMRDNLFPDPNSQRVSNENTTFYIENFMGSSTVEVTAPYMHHPILPYKDPFDFHSKLKFPIGTFEGCYTHAELNYAVENGYTINKVIKSIYYTRTMSPFKDFVDDMYGQRMYYKGINDPTQIVYKDLMNNLYGKFGQKFDGVEVLIHRENVTAKDLERAHTTLGKNYYLIEDNVEPAGHCIPIWASYVAAYGRIKHHQQMPPDCLYCDTDSYITMTPMETSKELGGLKLEMFAEDGFIVRPKVYGLSGNDGNKEIVRIKGLAKAITFDKLCNIKSTERFEVLTNTSMKESVKGYLLPNELFKSYKTFDLEDDKRIWPDVFDANSLQQSQPIRLGNPVEEMMEMEQLTIDSYDEIYEMMS